MGKECLLIDTDLSTDDVLGILYCLQEKVFDLKTLCIVAGNLSLDDTIERARDFVSRLPINLEISIHSGNFNMMHPGANAYQDDLSRVYNDVFPEILQEKVRPFTKVDVSFFFPIFFFFPPKQPLLFFLRPLF